MSDPRQARAADLHRRLTETLRTFGWPVETDFLPELGDYRCYCGPVTLSIETRREDWHPPGADLVLSAHAPLIYDAPNELWAYTDADQPVDDLVSWADQSVALGRRDALHASRDNESSCAICADRHPRAHLLPLDDEPGNGLAICPSCTFDEDLVAPWTPEIVAYHLDELLDEQLAAPPGWNAIIALFACAASPDWRRDLPAMWHGNNIMPVPSAHWATPEHIWLWLPLPSTRPPALRHFGCGASLGAVVAAIDNAFPTACEQAADRVTRSLVEIAQEVDEDPLAGSTPFLPHLWPAAVAYLISFHTQSQERSQHRSPWHLWHSLDLELGRLDTMGRSDDVIAIRETLTISIDVLASHLKINTD